MYLAPAVPTEVIDFTTWSLRDYVRDTDHVHNALGSGLVRLLAYLTEPPFDRSLEAHSHCSIPTSLRGAKFRLVFAALAGSHDAASLLPSHDSCIFHGLVRPGEFFTDL